LIFNGALTLAVGGAAGPLTFSGTGTTTYAGNISTGVNGMVLQGPGTVFLTGTNSFSGGATISSGTLNINSDRALGAANGVVNLNGGTLQFAASGGIALNSSRSIMLGGGAIDTNSGNDVVNGVISGTNLVKIGLGTLTLTNANTYTGGTAISAGTLAANNGSGSATGTGNVVVSGTLAGFGSVIPGAGNSVTVNAGGAIRGGVADGTHNYGTLGVSSSATVNAGGGITVEVNRTGANQVNASLVNLSSSPTAIFSLGTAAAPLGGGAFVTVNVLDTSTSLVAGETYVVNLVKGYQANLSSTTTSNFQLNGITYYAGETVDSQIASTQVGINGLLKLNLQNNPTFAAATGWSVGVNSTGQFFQLTLAPVSIWTGAVSALWTSAGNWSTGLVPSGGMTSLFNQ
jgi:autotransporter-associated beta strand protein